MVKYVIVIEFTIFKLRKVGDYLLSLCIMEVWVKGKEIRVILMIIILFINLVVVSREFNAACMDLRSNA